jgi:probable rRNA maturation factor
MSDEPGSTHLDIAVSLHDAAWLGACPDLERRTRAAVRSVLQHLDVEGPLEISLVFTDDAEQHALNRDYRRKDRPTNVLSFPNMEEPGPAEAGLPRLIGDVVLARETIVREALEQDKSTADHTTHLLVHGTLHLFGYEHEEAAEAAEMEALERTILAGLGIADPYAGGRMAAEGATDG